MNLNNPETIEEVLAHCLDDLKLGISTREEALARYPMFAEELTGLLALIGPLTSLGNLTPREAFTANASQLMSSMLPDRDQSFPQNLLRMWQSSRLLYSQRLRAVYLALMVGLTFFFLMVGGIYTVDAAEPGDLLYGFDQKLEQVQLALALNPEAAAKTRLGHAAERLAEAQHKLDRGELEHAMDAIASYSEEISFLAGLEGNPEAVDPSILAELLKTARTTHVDVLNELLARVPEQAQTAIKHAIEVSSPAVDAPGGSSRERPSVPAEGAGPPEGVPAGPPNDVGPPDNVPAGPPEDVGLPGEVELPTEVPINPLENIGPPDGLPADLPEEVGLPGEVELPIVPPVDRP
jgi:hypothetical protein